MTMARGGFTASWLLKESITAKEEVTQNRGWGELATIDQRQAANLEWREIAYPGVKRSSRP
jgi:hypothetical protein